MLDLKMSPVNREQMATTKMTKTADFRFEG